MCLEYTNNKDDLIEYKYLSCNWNYQKKFDRNLKKRSLNTYKFSNHDINKFTLFLRKNVYPNEYMHDCEKFSEKSLSEKEYSYSHLNIKNITDADYKHSQKRVCKFRWAPWFVCYTMHQYAKANNKCMKDYNEIKKPSYLKYWA